MDYRNLTILKCLEYSKNGWAVILHNGRILGFKKKGASITRICAKI